MKITNQISFVHLLTVLLAFVAGAAFMTDSPFDSESTSDDSNRNNSTITSDNAPITVSNNEPTATNNESASVSAGKVPVPDSLPLYVQNELEDLREDNTRMREQLDELFDTVAALSRASSESINITTADDADASFVAALGNEQNPQSTSGFDQFFQQQGPSREVERGALVKAGIDESRAVDLLRQRDAFSLERLELFDRATREGWINTDRLSDELNQLDESSFDLRDQLSDEEYREFLFNSGQNNRVVVNSILAGASAEAAGLLVGDVIDRYAGQAIFTMGELRDATRSGSRDEPVVLEVLRGQQPLSLDVVRGPLGITMGATRIAP